jgi:hypothetical protein
MLFGGDGHFRVVLMNTDSMESYFDYQTISSRNFEGAWHGHPLRRTTDNYQNDLRE